MNIPNWWEFVLLALLSFRVWRLFAEDDILDKPRRRLLRAGNEWKKEGDPVPEGYRLEWALFLTCPWCAGAWISGLMYLCWLGTLGEWPGSFGDGLVSVGVWFALSAVVGLVRGNLDPPEE